MLRSDPSHHACGQLSVNSCSRPVSGLSIRATHVTELRFVGLIPSYAESVAIFPKRFSLLSGDTYFNHLSSRCKVCPVLAPVGVTLWLFGVICSSSLVGASFLLSVGCGSSVTSSSERAPSPPSNASPSTEGTGLESPLPRITDTNSVSLPSLPSGHAGQTSQSSDKVGCFDLNFLADKPVPPGMVVTVTRLAVTGPFKLADPAATGCLQGNANPICTGWQLRANSGTECIFAVLWDGTGENQENGDVQGSASFKGTLSCATASRAACLRYASILLNSARGMARPHFPSSRQRYRLEPPRLPQARPPRLPQARPPRLPQARPPRLPQARPPRLPRAPIRRMG